MWEIKLAFFNITGSIKNIKYNICGKPMSNSRRVLTETKSKSNAKNKIKNVTLKKVNMYYFNVELLD